MIEEQPTNHKNVIAPDVLEELRKVLGEDYSYATSVVTYAEVQSLEFNYTGMAEFRDALTHVKRAIYENDEKKALDEINSVSEHIRRAAVESMQEYIESRYVNFRRNLYFPYSLLKNRVKTDDLENELKLCIIKGRDAKPSKKWRESIGYFKKAEDILVQLEDKIQLPTKNRWNTKVLFYLFVALLIGYSIGSNGLL